MMKLCMTSIDFRLALFDSDPRSTHVIISAMSWSSLQRCWSVRAPRSWHFEGYISPTLPNTRRKKCMHCITLILMVILQLTHDMESMSTIKNLLYFFSISSMPTSSARCCSGLSSGLVYLSRDSTMTIYGTPIDPRLDLFVSYHK